MGNSFRKNNFFFSSYVFLKTNLFLDKLYKLFLESFENMIFTSLVERWSLEEMRVI